MANFLFGRAPKNSFSYEITTKFHRVISTYALEGRERK
jgi:hypothetical protein